MKKEIENLIKSRARQFARKGVVGMEYEDLVQSGYVWILENGDRYEAERKAQYGSWVYSCITNVFREIYRSTSFRYTEMISDTISNTLQTVGTDFYLGDLSKDGQYVCSLILNGTFSRLFKKEIRDYLYEKGWQVERVNLTFKEIESYVASL